MPAAIDGAVGKPTKETAPHLAAAEIVDKNVAARSGLTAWRAANTLKNRIAAY